MNILQILPEMHVGGVETGTLDLAKALVKLGHKAVVVSGGGELVGDLESAGAIHYRLPVYKKSLSSILKMIPQVAEIIRAEEIDIVHARSRVPAWIAYFAARRTNRVFITTAHGYYRKHYFSRPMGWGKRVVVVSNAIARHMIEDFGVSRERVVMVPRGVDLNKFTFRKFERKVKNDFVVGIVGRFSPIKGHLHFVQAMARVARSIPHLKIWIVGDAPASRESYKEQIQVMVKRLGLWHCTEFLGTKKDIPKVLSQLDLLVLATTTHEAFGRVIVEAQASGVPVVATEVGGVVDVVENGKTGLLIPPADPASMAEAVIRLYKDTKLAARLVENAYRNVKRKYNLDLMIKNTLNLYEEALSNFRILIIKLSSLGDIILSTAALRAIREKFPPNYKISFLVGEESKEALLRCPYIDELLVADFKNKEAGLRGFIDLARRLRSKNFDIAIDLQNNRKSHILSFLTLSLKRYGYDNKKFSFLLNCRIPDDQLSIAPVKHQFRILEMLGIDLVNPQLELWPSPEDACYIDELLTSQWISVNQKIVGISVSASERWLTKSWPVTHMAKLCEELGRKQIRVVITGTEKDLELAKTIANMAKDANIINACGKTTVNQLASLIKRCAVFVCVDSSPLHIAAAMNTPFVALFGPTDPNRHLPPAKNFVVIKKDWPCRPCYKSKCRERKCMELINPTEVLATVEALLDSRKE